MIILFSELVFLCYRYFKSKQQITELEKNTEHYVSEALLRLWQVKNLLEFVELIRSTLQNFFPNANCIHCFVVNDKSLLFDFYSEQPIQSQFLRNRFHETFSRSHFQATFDECNWLIANKYVSSNEHVYSFLINNTSKCNNTNLLFLICNDETLDEVPGWDTFVQHACACFTQITNKVAMQPLPSDETHHIHADFHLSDIVPTGADATSMQVAINKYLMEKTLSEGCCFLIVTQGIKQLVCQVVDDKSLIFQASFPMDEGLFCSTCINRKATMLDVVTQQEAKQLKSLFSHQVKSALFVPILDENLREPVSIVCLCNKLSNRRYTTSDVATVKAVAIKTWNKLENLLTIQKERKARNECEAMLQIARNLFTHLDDVGTLLGQIIQEARSLTNAERCSVFLVDDDSQELVAKVFDGIVTNDESLDPRQYDFENMNEVRIPLDQGIAGHVASTGKTLNIADAYSHPLFYRGIDDSTGFKTRNILCFPIKDHNGVVVGVSQLCNKINGPCFTAYDEELAERFAIFSGISISHSLQYRTVEESGSRSRLANDLVAYNMKVDSIDVDENMPLEHLALHDFDPEFSSFTFKPRNIPDDRKIEACILMYKDLGLTSTFHISMRTLVHFLLMVRKGYRDPPYHNWEHAFSVMHHAYLLCKHLLSNKLSDLEMIALLTASVCHDLDHRGTNNAFQVDSQSILASLYSSEGSVMERHHFAQAVCVISTAGCNIFENMKRQDYSHTLSLMKHLILATDVATHLDILPHLEDMAANGVDFNNPNHRKHLLSLCMTASDLSDQTKDWQTTKNTSKLIYKEFFSQGDMEKNMGNLPALIHDRERACVPQLQINFMQHIALPVYRILSTIFKEYEEIHTRIRLNIARWRRVVEEFKSRNLPNTVSLDFLTDDFDRDLFLDLDVA